MTINPKNMGYYIIYFFTAFVSLALIWLIFERFFGSYRPSIIEWICCILAPAIFLVFSFHFLKVKIRIQEKEIIIVKFMWKNREANDKRKITDILFSQNGQIQRIVTETVDLNKIKQYGLTKDLGMDYAETVPPMPRMDLYLCQEIVFIMENNETKSLNGRPYTKKSIRKLRDYIKQTTGIEPTGSLKDL